LIRENIARAFEFVHEWQNSMTRRRPLPFGNISDSRTQASVRKLWTATQTHSTSKN